MCLSMRFMRSSSFDRVKFWSLELTALNLLPSMEWFWSKSSSWSHILFHSLKTFFSALGFSFRKSAMVWKSGVCFWQSHMTSMFLVVSLAIFLLEWILL